MQGITARIGCRVLVLLGGALLFAVGRKNGVRDLATMLGSGDDNTKSPPEDGKGQGPGGGG